MIIVISVLFFTIFKIFAFEICMTLTIGMGQGQI